MIDNRDATNIYSDALHQLIIYINWLLHDTKWLLW